MFTSNVGWKVSACISEWILARICYEDFQTVKRLCETSTGIKLTSSAVDLFIRIDPAANSMSSHLLCSKSFFRACMEQTITMGPRHTSAAHIKREACSSHRELSSHTFTLQSHCWSVIHFTASGANLATLTYEPLSGTDLTVIRILSLCVLYHS